MVYLNTKDLVDIKLSFNNLEFKHSLKTSYDWWIKNKNHGFFVRDDETKKLKKWNKESRVFEEEDENQYWYENDEGNRRSYLQDFYTYEVSFPTPVTVNAYNNETKLTEDMNVTSANLNLTWSQNNKLQAELKRIKDDIGFKETDSLLVITKVGRGYDFKFAGKKDGSKMTLPEIKDDMTSVEKAIVEQVKDSGVKYSYKDLIPVFEENGLDETRGKWLYETHMS